MGVNVALDRAFSYLLSLPVLAVLSGIGACCGFLLGIVGVGVAWALGLSAGKGLIVVLTTLGTLIGFLTSVKYCKTTYWSEQKLR